MGFIGVLGLGFGVSGLGFRVWGLGFRVRGLGFRVRGLGFRVPIKSCTALDPRPELSQALDGDVEFRVRDLGASDP